MRDVTDYATIPSPHVVRQREAEALVRSWAGPGSTLRIDGLIGRGAAHAFGRQTGRFQLAGHSDLLDMVDGLDRAPEHRFGSGELARELELRERSRRAPLGRDRLPDLVVAEEFESMWEYIEDVSVRDRIPLPAALRTGHRGMDSMPAIRNLVASIPSARTWSTMRYLKHRDLNLPWEQHDWTDLWSLSVAIPYCDVVATEKRWKHLSVVGGLDRHFGTKVVSGRTSLISAISCAQP